MTEHSAMGNKQALPTRLPIFPLRNALLLPHGRLPLNIFEPRYLEMTDTALGQGRLIGMVRPKSDGGEALYQIGCVGRIINFMETDDGRYLITLAGMSRFHLSEDITDTKPYRIAKVSWAGFENDLWEAEDDDPHLRKRLLKVLQTYLDEAGLKADWESIEGASVEAIMNSIAMSCPFGADEQQALLEATSISARAETLITLMEISVAAGHNTPESKPSRLQ